MMTLVDGQNYKCSLIFAESSLKPICPCSTKKKLIWKSPWLWKTFPYCNWIKFFQCLPGCWRNCPWLWDADVGSSDWICFRLILDYVEQEQHIKKGKTKRSRLKTGVFHKKCCAQTLGENCKVHGTNERTRDCVTRVVENDMILSDV